MAEREVKVLCYLDGGIKHGPDGVYFEGSTPKEMGVKKNTNFSSFLDGLYLMTGLDKKTSTFTIFARLPSLVQSMVKYELSPVMCDSDLERMINVPSNHPSINTLELYLEVKPTASVVPPAHLSRPMENPGGPSKRQKTTQKETADRCNLKKVDIPGASEPRLLRSSLWLEDGTTVVGLCFKDRDEMRKAVDWRSIRGQHKCVVRETGKDDFTFECIRWKCKWLIRAVRMEEHGLFEITSCNGPDACKQRGEACPDDFDEKFLAYEIGRVVSEHPTLSVPELHKWWNEKFGSEQTFLTQLDEEGEEVSDARTLLQDAKKEAIKRLFGDWDQSFRFITKLMSALHSSNGLLVDWQYDSLPNPEHASFRSMFWAFSQSVEGFQHCRPLVVVDSKQLKGKYNMKLMIASGFDAANNFFPLAFAVTKEISIDSWRWFLTRIREKVTQRKGLCLTTRHHPDIPAAVNEPGSQWKEPWAYHRFCLNHLSSQLSRLFPDHHLTECLVMNAGSSSQKGEFDSYMKDIKEKSPEGWKWLDQIPPHQWALAHDRGLRYGVMEIDRKALFAVCRSFQKVAMTGGVMLLFSEMKDAFDVSFSSSRGSLHRGDVYTENVMKKFQESLTDSAAYVVMPLERDAFQVSGPSKKKGSALMRKYKEYKECIVQLNDSTCTCGKFQRTRFPCLHALVVCQKMKINPLSYVDDCYSAKLYYNEATFSPVPKLSTWPEASGVPTLLPPASAPPPLKVSVEDHSFMYLCYCVCMSKINLEKEKAKAKAKSKEPPSDEELRNAILDILKAMDFKMASFTDIIKQLAEKFRYDLTPRKSSIEVMIQYELEKYAADSEEDEEEEEDDDEEEDKRSINMSSLGFLSCSF